MNILHFSKNMVAARVCENDEILIFQKIIFFDFEDGKPKKASNSSLGSGLESSKMVSNRIKN